MTDNYTLIYTTTNSELNAQEISKALLEASLIACSNIYSNVNSIYKWEGEIQSSSEFVLILKSKAENFSEIERLILDKHNYECPVILQIPILKMNSAYQNYLKNLL